MDATLNDAFLAAIAGGMRRYHERHLAMVDHLRVSMPVSVRAEGDAPGGNRVTIERFELPVGMTDPHRRMERIGQICRSLRSDRAIPYASAIAGVLNLLPVDVTAGMLKHVDMLASNVPGFPAPVYMGGRPPGVVPRVRRDARFRGQRHPDVLQRHVPHRREHRLRRRAGPGGLP